MNKVRKTHLLALLCIILSVMTLLAMMPGAAYAQEDTGGSPAQAGQGETAGTPASQTWDYSKSKTASKLTADSSGSLTSDITLSLPSKEDKLASEICFVLDKSSFSDTKGKAMDLLNSLKTAIAKNGAEVTVDIVCFNRTAHDYGTYDLGTEYEKIENAFTKKDSGGTNMHAGLLLAKEKLEKNTSIPNSRKYMILVSDGDTYLHCKDGDYTTPYTRSFAPVESAGNYAYGGYYDEAMYYPSAPYGNNVKRPDTSDPDSWDSYLKDVAARNAESGGDRYDFVWNYYDAWITSMPTKENPNGFKTQPCVPRSASNIDMAFYCAANVYHELASNYHCSSVAVQSLNQADGGHKAFMEYLNGGATADFSTIENEILYLVGAGSTVTDQIGYKEGDYNFDLVDPAKMTLSIDDAEGKVKTYEAEKISENHYGFLPQSDGTYAYEAVYTPGDKKADEQIKWTINVPVTNFQHVSLNYQVKLTSPKTKAGTYGQKDFNGDGIVDGTKTAVDPSRAIYTNTSAVLVPVDSAGKTGAAEAFGKPSVSYTVDKPNPTDPDADKKASGFLLPKVIAKGKHTQVLTWTALKHVDGYFIYTNRCNVGKHVHTPKKVADYKASKARVYTRKHLKTHRNYKYYVAAYKIKNGRKVIVKRSITVHSVCGNSNARFTNTKAVKVKKHAVTLKAGQTYKIKANVYKVKKNRALLNHRHASRLRYLSRNSRIAKVSYSTGKVKALKAGKTTIYVLGVNGVRDKVAVTVK